MRGSLDGVLDDHNVGGHVPADGRCEFHDADNHDNRGTTPPVYTPPPVPEYPPPAPVVITYKVYGAKRASVTYSMPNFGQQQDTSVRLPWSKKVEDVDYPVLVAQNAAGGSITCEILRDGESISKNTSTGDYAVVTCS